MSKEKDKEKKTAVSETIPEFTGTMEPPAPAPLPPPPAPGAAAPAPPMLLLTFDRWFSSKGFPDHWKGGMKAFKDTTGKRTLAAWDSLFKDY